MPTIAPCLHGVPLNEDCFDCQTFVNRDAPPAGINAKPVYAYPLVPVAPKQRRRGDMAPREFCPNADARHLLSPETQERLAQMEKP